MRSTHRLSEMTHHVFHVAGAEAKKELVHRLASGTGPPDSVSCAPNIRARKLAKQLTEAGVPSVDLHGKLVSARPRATAILPRSPQARPECW